MVVWFGRIKYGVAETFERNARDRYRRGLVGGLHTTVSIITISIVSIIVVSISYRYGFQNAYLR